MRWNADCLKQLALILLAVFITAAGIYAHGTSVKKEIRIGLFAGSNWSVPEGDSYAVVNAAIARFEAEHPNVKVTYQSGIKKEDYAEWLAEKLLAGEEPDVFVVPDEDFNLYASNGALADLTDLAEDDESFQWEVYYPAALQYGSYGSGRYALPIGTVPTLMVVNKSLLAREGIPLPQNNWTWQDFLAICRAVTKDTDGDGKIDQFGVYDYNWQLAAVTNQVQLFREDGRASYFADPHMEEVVRFMIELHKVERGREVTAKDFDMGRVAFRPFSFAEYRTYKPYPWRIKKYSSFEWDCIKLPAGPSGKNVSRLQTMLMGISERSRHKGLAWELLKTMCYDEEIQQVMMTKSQGLSARRDVVESEEAQKLFQESVPGSEEMDLRMVSEIMDDSVMENRFKGYEEAMLRAQSELTQIINGTVPFNNALNKLQKEINAYLQQ